MMTLGEMNQLGRAVAVAAALLLVPAAMAAETSPTKISGQVFANFSNLQIDDQRNDNEGWQPDLKRFYIDVEHSFNADWMLKVTTDVQWQRQQDPTDVWFRHAYVQRNWDNGYYLKLGVAELPWIDYVARRVGYRYIDPSINPKNQFAEPTDLGVHVGQKGEHFSYGVAMVTGAGFKKPKVADQVDIEAAAIWHVTPTFDLAMGWYEGARALDKGSNLDRLHNAQRWNMALSYMKKGMRAGVEYVYNDNWKQVTSATEDASDGWSAWASYAFSAKHSAFVRYDITHPSRRLKPELEQDYLQLGVDWKVMPSLTLAFVAKQSDIADVIIDHSQNEVGVWAMWNW
ncbi:MULTISPECIES: hypothetical protein [Pseudidiomarina]|uniref:Porin n=2 Tax=Pseudidiomarina TaxID=2800384 RepID=A0A368V242_9GAMM|nr:MULTISPECIES: hypothetical protein [Pseudidiomarina]PWW14186.1 hypothetical protein DET45_104125 [Pseudidiomarina maritima]RBP92000.1 hypothetical protein DFO81_103125 [Pseudidiomarina tainanensis]RCW33764.1 hypothetical protein DFO79_104145 [Pseudidiomarina tainanensis]